MDGNKSGTVKGWKTAILHFTEEVGMYHAVVYSFEECVAETIHYLDSDKRANKKNK